MKETGTIFQGWGVRAILEGRKTQTRRVIKPQPPSDWGGTSERAALLIHCPYGQVGDRLWVRETHIAGRGVGGYAPGVDPDKEPFGKTIDVIYRADDGENERTAGPWTPSIHMRRVYSRITLEITGVKVERIQDISEEDAKAEGITAKYVGGSLSLANMDYLSYQAGFCEVWDSINAKRGYGWNVNPWDWALTFKVVK